MSSDRNKRSTAERILSRSVKILRRLERGASLQAVSGSARTDRILWNLVLATVRHRALVDWLIDGFARGRIRPRLRPVLQWGIVQILYMDGLPPEVTVDTCVEFVKRRYSRSEAGFVNALLRRTIREYSGSCPEEIKQDAPPHVRLELGEVLYNRWAGRFSEEELQHLSEAFLEEAPVTVRLRKDSPAPELESVIPLPKYSWAPGVSMWKCTDPAAFFECRQFNRGNFYVQDLSTLAAPLLLEVQPGELIGDLCASPGGKAAILAEALDCRGCLVVNDRSRNKMKRLRSNLPQTKVVYMTVADATVPPLQKRIFDALLLDVPCCNTGVVRRRPDVRWRFSEKALRRLVALQKQLLAAASGLIKPGGRLVYSTCSMEPEENREQIDGFLSDFPAFSLEREIELLPCTDHDGAYAALLFARRA